MRRDAFSRIAAVERRTGRAVGRGSPREEPLRFLPDPELCFEATELTAESPERWTTRMLGLSGASGALPTHLAEEIALEDPDHGLRRALLAPFHHRMTALAHRSVHGARFPDAACEAGSIWPAHVASLVSIGEPDARSEATLLWLAPLLHGRPSAASLARALTLVSRRWLGGVRIVLRARDGGRSPVAPADRARLGRTRLGDDALLGSSVADPASRATIEIDPVAPAHRAALAAGGAARIAIQLLASRMSDATGTLSVRVRREGQALCLGRAQLGTSTLGTRPRALRAMELPLHESATTDATST